MLPDLDLLEQDPDLDFGDGQGCEWKSAEAGPLKSLPKAREKNRGMFFNRGSNLKIGRQKAGGRALVFLNRAEGERLFFLTGRRASACFA